MVDKSIFPSGITATEFPQLKEAAQEIQSAAEEARPKIRIGQLEVLASHDAVLPYSVIADAPKEIKQATRELAEESVSKNTLSSYIGALRRLGGWLTDNGKRDLDDLTLALYLVHFYQEGKSASVAAMAVAAVTFQAKFKQRSSPVGPRAQMALAGYRRKAKARGRGQVKGIDWAQADKAAALAADGSAKGARDAALLSVMSDALLGANEVIDLKVGDVQFQPDGSARLLMRTRGEGAGQYLGEMTVRRVRRWLAWTNPGPEAPLFPRLDKAQRPIGSIGRQGIRLIIVARAKAIGIEGGVGSHSLRLGAAQSLAGAGASVGEMQTAGGWKSPTMPVQYSRGELAGRGAVARLRYGKRRG